MPPDDWPSAGDAVVEYHMRSTRYAPRTVDAVVDRVGSRDIVLDNGNRYNRRRLRRVGADHWELLAADNPRVTNARLHQAEEDARAKVRRLVDAIDAALRSNDAQAAHEPAQAMAATVASYAEASAARRVER